MRPFAVQQLLISGLQKSDITIFDVGANRGQTARRYRLVFPNAEIYCFEPFFPIVDILKKKLAGDKNVHVVAEAVSDTTGKAAFYLNRVDQANSLLQHLDFARKHYAQQTKREGMIDVETITLDEFVLNNEIATVDILKLDIQGGELKALRGARNLLQYGNIHLIYTETWFAPHYKGAPLLHDLWSFLGDHGYSLFDIFDVRRATNGQLRFCDAIFVSEFLRRTVVDKLF